MTRGLYYVTAFVTGACVMSLEMIGFRLFAPYFGYSMYVTGSLISVVLLAMALGYLFGGWLADRSHSDLPLYASLGLASLCLVGVMWAAPLLLRTLQHWGFVSGTLLGAFLLFTIPMFLLSASPPYLIRLLVRDNKVGLTAGQIVAVSTLGSIAGTLLASFYLIPAWGVRCSLLAWFGVIFLLSWIGLLRHHRRFWILGCCIGFFWLPPATVPPWFDPQQFQVLWETESLYSRLMVVKQRQKQSVFVMPTYHFIHSEKTTKQRLSHSEQDVYNVGGLLNYPPQQILLLGLGAGTTFLQLRYFFPKARITGVDIDATMIAIGQRFFGFRPDDRTRVLITDARLYIQQSTALYDLIAINLTVGSIFLPFHIATQEAFQQMARRLSPRGWVLINLIDPEPERHLTRCVMKAMNTVFPHKFWVPFAGNTVVFASRYPIDPKFLRAISQQKAFRELEPLVQKILATQQPWKDSSLCSVWTDDRSTLESMTLRSFLKIQQPH